MEGENLKNVPGEGEDVEVTLDLGSLKEAVQKLQKEIDEELTFEESDFEAILSEEEEEELEEDMTVGASAGVQSADEEEAETEEFKNLEEDLVSAIVKQLMEADSEALEEYATSKPPKPPPAGDGKPDEDDGDEERKDENIDLDSLVDAITEKLTVDMGADLSGWAGRPDFEQKHEIEKEMAHRRSTEVAEEMEVLKKAQEELVFENKQLTSKLTQYEQVTLELKETLQTVNLSNARLLYTNRVLRNTSLNERQKSRIVEAISKADSVTEAKTIYNTLESTVESAPKRGPKSLSEAIHRPTSVIRASRHSDSQPTDVFAERMRKLAGIN